MSQVYIRTLARLPLDESIAIAQEWMTSHPEDYEINLHLSSYLANAWVHSSGPSGTACVEMLEDLMEPLLSEENCTVSTIKSGILYSLLLQRCHVKIQQEWISANIEDCPPESRTMVLEELKLAHREVELALLERVALLQNKLEEAPWRISKYPYMPQTVGSELQQVRRALDVEIAGKSRAVDGVKRTLAALEKDVNLGSVNKSEPGRETRNPSGL